MKRDPIVDQFRMLELMNQATQAKIEAMEARLELHEVKDRHTRLLADLDRLNALIAKGLTL